MLRALMKKLLGQNDPSGMSDPAALTEAVALVSFPKSGNTWARFLLANAMKKGDEAITFPTVGQYIPDIHRHKDSAFVNDPGSPFNVSMPVRVFKAHHAYQQRFRQAIVILRDGRDALTSYYHWIQPRRDRPTPLPDIIKGDTLHGLWGEHTLSWLRAECDAKLIVRYEDMLANPATQLRRMLEFLGVERDRSRIDGAVVASSFEQMQASEKQHGVFDGHIAPIKKTPFVRQGKSGAWRELFTDDDLGLFWEIHGEAMRAAGYGDDAEQA